MAGLVGPAASQTTQPASGGRVVVAAEFEPDGLQHWMVCCTLSWTQWMVDNLLPDAYRIAPDFTYVPEVLDGEAVVTTDPFTVSYTIKQEAVWNDGTPVSARDLVFTWRTYKSPRVAVASRQGYDLITSATITGDKAVTFSFRKPYPDYKQLFTDILPRHTLAGKDLNHAWRRSIPISAGPFEFGEWIRGSHLTLVRNDDYWGELAYLDEVEFRFIQNVPNQIDALETGEVDVIYPSLHPRLADVRNVSGVSVQTSPGTLWEHIDFQFKDELLRKPFVRRAIGHAIDREAIVETLIRPIDPEAAVLDSLLYLTNEPAYEAHFDIYRHDPAETHRILEDHGCTRGPDGIYRCAGRRLGIGYVTTRGNAIRKDLAELVVAQLAEVGIEVDVRRGDPAVVFGPFLVGGRYDMFNFAWVATPIAGDRGIWQCDGVQNFHNHCNEDVDALLAESAHRLDPAEQARLVNMADDLMARALVALPLYQRPTFLAHSARVQGMVDNPTSEGFTWNIGDWWVQP